ncbi:MAG TPA: DUF2089 family protein [Leptospiraceae bacterium]|nr:DUF2089 domain-containing protein [Leptospirales bacterium]HMU84790.1 DUF2089 family protein [Leptospiraceae bacterium]HMW59559.1 DUF2089 family protein [Leptospiraceae bacterium]HMY44103.1 DUF2089 family protein [Leptospiraceae bacterium]HMZ36150.1 DUF2089 family protein [Leptospiraceae bacterium]
MSEGIDSSLACPSCRGPLRPRILGCDVCGIKVEGPFVLNEFATLSPEDLHFLRVFVKSEGRVREMQAALGLSYPTVRARLSALKDRLSDDAPAKSVNSPTEEILSRLSEGKINFEQAMKEIKALPPKKE